MKKINLFGKTFFRKGYVEIKDAKIAAFPRELNRVYNVDPNFMNNREVEVIFSKVLRGLSY